VSTDQNAKSSAQVKLKPTDSLSLETHEDLNMVHILKVLTKVIKVGFRKGKKYQK